MTGEVKDYLQVKSSITCKTLNLSNLPTSSDDLVSGDVWSNSGVLNIVA